VSAGRGVLFVLAGQALFFWHQKTSVASLNAVENIKALEKTKVSAENFCIEVSAWAWPVDSQKFVRPI
jgi:hypothetical protein